jgi:hypothetical protein
MAFIGGEIIILTLLMTPRCREQRLSAPPYYLLSFLLLICSKWVWCVGALAALGKLNNHGRDNKAWILSKVQTALQVSKQSTRNITAAHEACRQWDEILPPLGDPVDNFPTLLDDNVLALCRAFHASTLVRVGQNEKAIRAYDSALDLQEFLDLKTKDDLIIGKAQAHRSLCTANDVNNF